MTYDIEFLGPPQRDGGKVWFPFRVSNGLSVATVPVGIPIEFNGTAEALGSKSLPRGELTRIAKAWLNSRLDKEYCDPFCYPETRTTIDVPLGVLDYWKENGQIQDWL